MLLNGTTGSNTAKAVKIAKHKVIGIPNTDSIWVIPEKFHEIYRFKSVYISKINFEEKYIQWFKG